MLEKHFCVTELLKKFELVWLSFGEESYRIYVFVYCIRYDRRRTKFKLCAATVAAMAEATALTLGFLLGIFFSRVIIYLCQFCGVNRIVSLIR